MATKTTVAVDQKLRKKLKKIGALLDITQGEVIERAVDLLEKDLITQTHPSKAQSLKNTKKKEKKEKKEDKIDIQKILADASEFVCQNDPEHKRIQESLSKGSITIDDVIISNWDTGLDVDD